MLYKPLLIGYWLKRLSLLSQQQDGHLTMQILSCGGIWPVGHVGTRQLCANHRLPGLSWLLLGFTVSSRLYQTWLGEEAITKVKNSICSAWGELDAITYKARKIGDLTLEARKLYIHISQREFQMYYSDCFLRLNYKNNVKIN